MSRQSSGIDRLHSKTIEKTNMIDKMQEEFKTIDRELIIATLQNQTWDPIRTRLALKILVSTQQNSLGNCPKILGVDSGPSPFGLKATKNTKHKLNVKPPSTTSLYHQSGKNSNNSSFNESDDDLDFLLEPNSENNETHFFQPKNSFYASKGSIERPTVLEQNNGRNGIIYDSNSVERSSQDSEKQQIISPFALKQSYNKMPSNSTFQSKAPSKSSLLTKYGSLHSIKSARSSKNDQNKETDSIPLSSASKRLSHEIYSKNGRKRKRLEDFWNTCDELPETIETASLAAKISKTSAVTPFSMNIVECEISDDSDHEKVEKRSIKRKKRDLKSWATKHIVSDDDDQQEEEKYNQKRKGDVLSQLESTVLDLSYEIDVIPENQMTHSIATTSTIRHEESIKDDQITAQIENEVNVCSRDELMNKFLLIGFHRTNKNACFPASLEPTKMMHQKEETIHKHQNNNNESFNSDTTSHSDTTNSTPISSTPTLISTTSTSRTSTKCKIPNRGQRILKSSKRIIEEDDE